jgi:hypothetical protein
VAIAVGCIWLANVATAQIRSERTPRPTTQALQGCVERWNQMRMSQTNTIAKVAANTGCAITLAYAYRAPKTGRSKCTPGQPLSKTKSRCIDSHQTFVCTLNRYGAYSCPSHATPSAAIAWNAKIDARGLLRLSHPPTSRPTVPLPSWAAKYPYKDGFILPWIERRGRRTLRAGLKLAARPSEGVCSESSETTTAPGALRCYANHDLFDPCFAAKASWPKGGVIAACAQAPGSTTFSRFLIRGRLAAK